MGKIVVRELDHDPTDACSETSLAEKRVIGPDGQPTKIWTIDANSSSFSTDLRLMFEKNVAKARRENMEKFGSPDRVAD